jgi:hypothetical protein
MKCTCGRDLEEEGMATISRTEPYYPLVMVCAFCCAITVAMKEGDSLHFPTLKEIKKLDPEEWKLAFKVQAALIRGHKSGKLRKVKVCYSYAPSE